MWKRSRFELFPKLGHLGTLWALTSFEAFGLYGIRNYQTGHQNSGGKEGGEMERGAVKA